MIDTVLFDMGGTLEDISITPASKLAAGKGVLDILAAHGYLVDADPDTFWSEAEAGMLAYNAYREPLNIELKPERIWNDYILKRFQLPEEAVDGFAEELAHMWEVTYYERGVRAGAGKMLEELRGMGMTLGIISNTASLFQVFDSLKEYGIRDYFRDVTLSSVTGYRKPHPYIFEVALHQLQKRPETCVYVGDTISRDIIGSKRAGFAKSIQIGSFLTKLKDVDVDPTVRPDFSIERISEVADAVRTVKGE